MSTIGKNSTDPQRFSAENAEQTSAREIQREQTSQKVHALAPQLIDKGWELESSGPLKVFNTEKGYIVVKEQHIKRSRSTSESVGSFFTRNYAPTIKTVYTTDISPEEQRRGREMVLKAQTVRDNDGVAYNVTKQADATSYAEKMYDSDKGRFTEVPGDGMYMIVDESKGRIMHIPYENGQPNFKGAKFYIARGKHGEPIKGSRLHQACKAFTIYYPEIQKKKDEAIQKQFAFHLDNSKLDQYAEQTTATLISLQGPTKALAGVEKRLDEVTAALNDAIDNPNKKELEAEQALLQKHLDAAAAHREQIDAQLAALDESGAPQRALLEAQKEGGEIGAKQVELEQLAGDPQASAQAARELEQLETQAYSLLDSRYACYTIDPVTGIPQLNADATERSATKQSLFRVTDADNSAAIQELQNACSEIIKDKLDSLSTEIETAKANNHQFHDLEQQGVKLAALREQIASEAPATLNQAADQVIRLFPDKAQNIKALQAELVQGETTGRATSRELISSSERRVQIEVLEGKMQKAEASLKEQDGKVDAGTSRIKELQTEIKELGQAANEPANAGRVGDLKHQIEAKKAQITQVRNEAYDMSELSDTRATRDQLTAEIETLKVQIANRKIETEALAKYEQAAATITQLQGGGDPQKLAKAQAQAGQMLDKLFYGVIFDENGSPQPTGEGSLRGRESISLRKEAAIERFEPNEFHIDSGGKGEGAAIKMGMRGLKQEGDIWVPRTEYTRAGGGYVSIAADKATTQKAYNTVHTKQDNSRNVGGVQQASVADGERKPKEGGGIGGMLGM